MLPIFPVSPVWADVDWFDERSEEVIRYDSGRRQGSSPWSRPLGRYTIIAQNYNEIKFPLIQDFLHQTNGMVNPFLWKFPYGGNNPYGVENVTQPSSTNQNSGDGFYSVNSAGWKIIPDSAFLYMDETGTGERVNGTHFVMSQDNGFITLLVSPGNTWTASCEYFRKVFFQDKVNTSSNIWNRFSSSIRLEEIMP